ARLAPGSPAARAALLVLLAPTLPCLAATYLLFEEGMMLRAAWVPVPLLALVAGSAWALLRPFGRAAVLAPALGALGTLAAGTVLCLA
ncbi:MAG: hypothetical protein AB1726_10435, partial [Planctomycetota bacterium]